MAAFRDGDSDRLDYLLLRDGPVVKYFDRHVLESDLTWLREHGYVVSRFDAGRWEDHGPLDEIARELEFPSYFGRNLNALNDCLRDLSIPEEGGRAIVFERYELAQKASSELA
jgi:hypothetical protein